MALALASALAPALLWLLPIRPTAVDVVVVLDVATSLAATTLMFCALTVALPPASTFEPTRFTSFFASTLRSPPKLSREPTFFRSVVRRVVTSTAMTCRPPLDVEPVEASAPALADARPLPADAWAPALDPAVFCVPPLTIFPTLVLTVEVLVSS